MKLEVKEFYVCEQCGEAVVEDEKGYECPQCCTEYDKEGNKK